MVVAEVYYVVVLLTSLAFILGYVMGRLGLSPAVGYLLAGFFAGFFIGIPETVLEALTLISEISIVLLFFEIGYEVHIENLSSLRGFPLYISVIELTMALGLASALSLLLGLSFREALVYGLIASFSSTVFTYKLLEEIRPTHEDIPKTVLMVAAVEDIIIVTVLTLMQGGVGGESASPLLILEVASLSLLLFLVSYEISKHVLPRILMPGEGGLILLITYGLLIGLVAGLLGLSPSLGAFIAGLTASHARGSKELMPLFKPVRAVFLMLFLVAMGLNISAVISSGTAFVLATILGALIVPVHAFATIVASVIASGLGVEYGLETGFYLSTISELSLVIAYVGYSVGLVGPEAMVVAATAMSIAAILASHLIYSKEQYIVGLLRWIPENIVSQIDYISLSIRKLVESKGHETVHRLLHVITHSIGEALIATFILVLVIDYVPWLNIPLIPITVLLIYSVLFYRLIIRANRATVKILEDVLGIRSHAVERAIKDLVASLIVFLSWEITALVLLSKYDVRLAEIFRVPPSILWSILLLVPPVALVIIFLALLRTSK